MAYAVIELLSLNLALNPLFCKTDVTCSLSYLKPHITCFFRICPKFLC